MILEYGSFLSQFAPTIFDAYHHFFPLETTTCHPADAPWFTARLKRLVTRRNTAHANNDLPLYRRLRNEVNREVLIAKKNHYPSKIAQLKSTNTSLWYSKIKKLAGLTKPSPQLPFLDDDPTVASTALNSHFSAICQTLPPLDHSSLPSYLPAPAPPPRVDELQVYNKLRLFKANRSVTPLDIPAPLFKEFLVELTKPLCIIVNASLQSGKSPIQWKDSFVTGIPKIPTPQSLGDMRPLSITIMGSLLCEGFVADWIYEDIAHVIDPRQYGNVRGASTTHGLIDFLDFAYKELEKRKTGVTATFIDFKKAFDLVDHTTVIKKCIAMGVRRCLIPWISDFLTNRRQAVRHQGALSDFLPITCGVPQGTKLGPLLFLILINDALIDTPHRMKYVDDCTITNSFDVESPDHSPTQASLDSLQSWTTDNHTQVNPTKTVTMTFSVSETPPPPLPSPSLTKTFPPSPHSNSSESQLIVI